MPSGAIRREAGEVLEVLVGEPDLSGVAPFVYCEGFHGALAQGLDVIQQTVWGQDVRRSWNQSKRMTGSKITAVNKSLAVPTGSSRWCS